jgi:hypothetical protein
MEQSMSTLLRPAMIADVPFGAAASAALNPALIFAVRTLRLSHP